MLTPLPFLNLVALFCVVMTAHPLTPVNAAKQGLPNHLDQSQYQDGQGEDGGQQSILIAAAENKRSLAAQRARQEAADAVLSCLSQSFLPALQVHTHNMLNII